MERTIRVTGKGKISVKPDTIRIVITQTNIEKSYEVAIGESAEKKRNLIDSLDWLGFTRENLKTLFFNVETEYESYQTKDKSWKQRLKGYRYTHKMKLEFAANNDMLGKVLLAISKCPEEPEFTIQHTISNPESAKNELLAKAVKDAKDKAVVLSNAADVKLKSILNIDYSWEEIDFVSRPMDNLMLRECKVAIDSSIDLDIEADDIEVTDTVTIVWEIEE